jgi:hypothetical protein
MSSPDFSATLSTLKTQFEPIAQSYAAEYTDSYRHFMDLVTQISKYPEYITSADLGDDFSGEWTDIVSTSVDILDAAGSSPLMQEILSQVEQEFGISVRTPLALAQNILQGNDSGLLQVVVALLQFEIKMTAFGQSCRAVYAAVSTLAAFIGDRGAGLDGLLEPDIQIPNDIIVALERARNQLQSTLMTPFDAKKYDLFSEEVRDVAAALEDVPIVKNAVDLAGNTAMKMFLDSSAGTIRDAYRLVEKAAEEAKNNILVIKNTNTTLKGANSKRFVMAKKAIRRINGILTEMKRGDVQQGVLIPKYIVALNVAYAILRTGRPVTDPASIGPMDVSAITVTTEMIDQLLASCRKVLLCTQKPARLYYLKDELTSLYGKLEMFEANVDSSQGAIETLASDATFEHAFEVAQTAIGLIAGLDFANMLLANGQYSEFFDLSEMTGTSEAAAQQSLSLMADLCDKIGIPPAFSSVLRNKAKEMEKQEREKRTKREVKKEKKKSKIASEIEKINAMIQEGQELFATVNGTLTALIELY